MQFLYFVEFFWKLLISTNTSNYNYRITSNESSKHDRGFRDDDLVHVEYVENHRVVRDLEDDNVLSTWITSNHEIVLHDISRPYDIQWRFWLQWDPTGLLYLTMDGKYLAYIIIGKSIGFVL